MGEIDNKISFGWETCYETKTGGEFAISIIAIFFAILGLNCD